MKTTEETASKIKKGISSILYSALSGIDEKYRAEEGFIRWGLVESDIYAVIDNQLIPENKSTITNNERMNAFTRKLAIALELDDA